MSVVGTLVVKFGESAVSESGGLIAEWDDSLNVDEEGNVKTQFVPGDELFLLVHRNSDVIVTSVKATAGTVSSLGTVPLQKNEELGFGSPDDEQTIRYNPAGNLTYSWKGRDGLGPVRTGKTVKVIGGCPCLAIVSYPVSFERYRLQTPKMTLAKEATFPYRVYIYFREIA